MTRTQKRLQRRRRGRQLVVFIPTFCLVLVIAHIVSLLNASTSAAAAPFLYEQSALGLFLGLWGSGVPDIGHMLVVLVGAGLMAGVASLVAVGVERDVENIRTVVGLLAVSALALVGVALVVFG